MQPHLLKSDLWLPTSEELPCSDDTPVGNENQNTLPNWLLAILEEIWGERQDWFFGVDMSIYDRQAQKKRMPVVVPDGFLSVGVQRHKREGKGRLSYVLPEENEVVPILAIEGQYQRQQGEPVWLPEIELGIGRVRGQLGGMTREWLAWHEQKI